MEATSLPAEILQEGPRPSEGDCLIDLGSIRVLVVDDFQPWRDYVSTTIQKQPGWQVAGEAADGLEAVLQAQQLEPDLILMDIGLPSINGIEAARRIKAVLPASRILFTSENRSLDVVEAAMREGAGYVLKADAADEMVIAMRAVLEGKRFISSSLTESRS